MARIFIYPKPYHFFLISNLPEGAKLNNMKHFETGAKVRIEPDNDNECYDAFSNKILIITECSNSGNGYDSSMYPQYLYSLTDLDDNIIPCSLYDYELVRV